MILTDPLTLLILSSIVLFGFFLIGIPIAISLALVGVLGLYFFQGDASLAIFIPFRTLDSFILTAIPLYIFMGEVLVKCDMSNMIYRGASRLFAWIPGGLFHSNIAACALFAAISGSSPATAATIGTVAVPELKRRNYDVKLTLGSLAAGGTLGILIPPSINMIVYGAAAEQSIGRLFAAGIIPGIMLSGIFMLYIALKVVLSKNKSLAPKEDPFTLKGLALGLVDLWPLWFLGVVVLGGVFSGIMTPTEAGAVGASASILLAIVLRRFSWAFLWDSLESSLETSCMVLFIVIGSSILAAFFSRAGIPQAVSELLIGSGTSKWMILLYVSIIYLILGCFVDPISMLLLTAPTVIPLIKEAGFDLIWFGIIYVVLSEIGMITPPMGLNLFVIQGISKEKLSDVIFGSLPFFGAMIVLILLVCVFPDLVIWLPDLLFGKS